MNKNNLFMIFLFIIGIILAITIGVIESNLPTLCNSTSLRSALKVLLIISVVLIVLSSSYVLCNRSCACDSQGLTLTTNIYIGIVLILGLVLMICGTIIKDEIKKSTCAEISTTSAWCIILLGLVCFVMSGVYFVYKYKEHITGAYYKLANKKA